MMTIAMIGQKGLPARSGGIERHVESLAAGLASRGHRVVVFGRRWYCEQDAIKTPAGVEQIFTKGIRTKHLDAITHSFTALWRARALRPDIVHIHGVGIALLTPLARILHPQAKVIVTFHCMDRLFSKWGMIARALFRLGEWFTCFTAHQVITVSQELHQYCARVYGRQTRYISHPFRFSMKPVSADRLADYGLVPHRYLLFVGRLLPHKGAHRLIEAYKRACRMFPRIFQRIPLVIVGGGSWTEGYVQSLKQLIKNTPNVFWLGEQSGEGLLALQQQALGHVFPTSEEGLSLAVLEAASTGRPVIMNDIEANREATGGYAIATDARDERVLAMALVGLVAMPEADRCAQGALLQAFVQSRFDFDQNVDEVCRFYQEVKTGSGTLTTIHPLLAFWQGK